MTAPGFQRILPCAALLSAVALAGCTVLFEEPYSPPCTQVDVIPESSPVPASTEVAVTVQVCDCPTEPSTCPAELLTPGREVQVVITSATTTLDETFLVEAPLVLPSGATTFTFIPGNQASYHVKATTEDGWTGAASFEAVGPMVVGDGPSGGYDATHTAEACRMSFLPVNGAVPPVEVLGIVGAAEPNAAYEESVDVLIFEPEPVTREEYVLMGISDSIGQEAIILVTVTTGDCGGDTGGDTG